MVNYCCVPKCKSKAAKGNGIKFHRFPNNISLKKQWIIKLRIEKILSKYAVVCSKHFGDLDYEATKFRTGPPMLLKKTAVPKQNIPAPTHESSKKSRRKVIKSEIIAEPTPEENLNLQSGPLNSAWSKLSLVKLDSIEIKPLLNITTCNMSTQTESSKLSFLTVTDAELGLYFAHSEPPFLSDFQLKEMKSDFVLGD